MTLNDIRRQDARGACLECLRQIEIPFSKTYSNPIDIGFNTITKSWAEFIKIHLLHPQQDGLALLQGNRTFIMKMEDEELVIGGKKNVRARHQSPQFLSTPQEIISTP